MNRRFPLRPLVASLRFATTITVPPAPAIAPPCEECPAEPCTIDALQAEVTGSGPYTITVTPIGTADPVTWSRDLIEVDGDPPSVTVLEEGDSTYVLEVTLFGPCTLQIIGTVCDGAALASIDVELPPP